MAYRLVGLGAAVSAVIAAGLVAACAPSVASMNCDRIAEEAKQISQGQALKITNLTNVREVSRTETEARCQGSATMSNNATTDMYLRAYRHDNGTMVEYSTQPFAAPGGQAAPPPLAQPPAQGAPPPQQEQQQQEQPPAEGQQ